MARRTKAEIEAELAALKKSYQQLQTQPSSINLTKTQVPTQEIKVGEIPGLTPFTPSTAGEMMPRFNPTEFSINNPYDPGLPTIDVVRYEKAKANYEGANRALDLNRRSFETTGYVFDVLKEKAKTMGKGVDAALTHEQTKGKYLDYQDQLLVNEQKAIALDVQAHRTGVDRAKAPLTKEQLDLTLSEAELKTQQARSEVLALTNQTEVFVAGIGG